MITSSQQYQDFKKYKRQQEAERFENLPSNIYSDIPMLSPGASATSLNEAALGIPALVSPYIKQKVKDYRETNPTESTMYGISGSLMSPINYALGSGVNAGLKFLAPLAKKTLAPAAKLGGRELTKLAARGANLISRKADAKLSQKQAASILNKLTKKALKETPKTAIAVDHPIATGATLGGISSAIHAAASDNPETSVAEEALGGALVGAGLSTIPVGSRSFLSNRQKLKNFIRHSFAPETLKAAQEEKVPVYKMLGTLKPKAYEQELLQAKLQTYPDIKKDLPFLVDNKIAPTSKIVTKAYKAAQKGVEPYNATKNPYWNDIKPELDYVAHKLPTEFKGYRAKSLTPLQQQELERSLRHSANEIINVQAGKNIEPAAKIKAINLINASKDIEENLGDKYQLAKSLAQAHLSARQSMANNNAKFGELANLYNITNNPSTNAPIYEEIKQMHKSQVKNPLFSKGWRVLGRRLTGKYMGKLANTLDPNIDIMRKVYFEDPRHIQPIIKYVNKDSVYDLPISLAQRLSLSQDIKNKNRGNRS